MFRLGAEKITFVRYSIKKSAFESLAALAKLYTKPPEYYLDDKIGVSL
ncbi:hypothetical protein DB44_CB00050 [Candidatus Protochlamydia amoebophila]|uniref:Uncharacterized protein n=1 Tax=Candidatus Protochlamydia amoebophila TaxID=362787 RepID=A0A0C1JN90_9BACT|nr:hypothetical protein DB44_CB00050 [Candidatus Protochlamydia amoebophila]